MPQFDQIRNFFICTRAFKLARTVECMPGKHASPFNHKNQVIEKNADLGDIHGHPDTFCKVFKQNESYL